ncbi:hypothetical protein MVEG_00539 [Podila verticillata NRRL 6337]|nr:hypothetical protein MVEG_00539 [Podila verticillata NRRL 6337]
MSGDDLSTVGREGGAGGGGGSAIGTNGKTGFGNLFNYSNEPSLSGIGATTSFGSPSFYSGRPSTDNINDNPSMRNDNNSETSESSGNTSSTSAKDISFLGGLALFICSTTGPGVVSLPLVAQSAGWIPTLVCFILVGFLSFLSSMFICEAMTNVPGNDRFQSNIEFSNLVLCFFGKRYQVLVQVICFLAVQTNNIASIAVCGQLFDNLLIRLFNRTCGIEIYPNPSFICVAEQLPTASPFSGVMIISAGVIVSLALIVPLGLMNLSENIWIQMVSAVCILLVILQWIVTFFTHGLDTSRVPVLGKDVSQTFGQILFNFAYVVNVPSWANAKKPGVSPQKTVGSAISLMTVLFSMVCILGGMAYEIPANSTMIQAIFSSPDVSVLSQVAGYTFPLAALITSIPVSIIVIRYNLVQSGTCSKNWANVLAGVVPWFIAVPCMTQAWLTTAVGWCSLFLVSSANYVIPFVLFIASKRQKARMDRRKAGDTTINEKQDPVSSENESRVPGVESTSSPIEILRAANPVINLEHGEAERETEHPQDTGDLAPPFLGGNNYTIPGFAHHHHRCDSQSSSEWGLQANPRQDTDYSLPEQSKSENKCDDDNAPWRFHAVYRRFPSAIIAWTALSLLSLGISATIVINIIQAGTQS